MYQIAHLGDDDDEPEFSSAMELEEGTTFFFTPRGLKNLVLVDEMESLAPIMSCQVLVFISHELLVSSGLVWTVTHEVEYLGFHGLKRS